GCLLLALLLLTTYAGARNNSDTGLPAEIDSIGAADNHAHLMSVADANGREDEEYDALRCGKLEFVSKPPVRLAIALIGMMKEGDITRERASELARLVMRENAARQTGSNRARLWLFAA
ncbi:MAG TPA: hypothetical protein VF717_17765, partial [Pyrinomonadaceae bacterium]